MEKETIQRTNVSQSRSTPSFRGLQPASAAASAKAKASSRKRDTECELLLRRALTRLGLRYKTTNARVSGRPDIVFPRAKVAIFCDGDFWHGRNLAARIAKLEHGHNAPYWVAKIQTNVARDRRVTAELAAAGWRVLRCWESEIRKDPVAMAIRIADLVQSPITLMRR